MEKQDGREDLNKMEDNTLDKKEVEEGIGIENAQETALAEVITPKDVVFTKKVEEYLTVAGESILAFFRKMKILFPLWWVEVAVIGILLMVFVLLFQMEGAYQRSQTYDYNQRLSEGVRQSIGKWSGDEDMSEQDLREFMSEVMRYNPGGEASFYMCFEDEYYKDVGHSFDRNIIVRCSVAENSDLYGDVYFCLDDYFDYSQVAKYTLAAKEEYYSVSYIKGYKSPQDGFVPVEICFEDVNNPSVEKLVVSNPATISLKPESLMRYLVDYDSSLRVEEGMEYEYVSAEIHTYNTRPEQNVDAQSYAWKMLYQGGMEEKSWKALCNAKGGFDVNGGGFSAYDCYVKLSGGGVAGVVAMTFPVNKMILTSPSLWSRMTCVIIILQGGAFVGFFLRRKMKNKQAQLDAMRNTFINAVAHEMKMPTAVIKNSTECILENICPEKNEHYLRMIAKETDRMNDLLTKMLIYTRTANSVYELRKDTIDLPKIVEDVHGTYKFAMELRELTLTVQNYGLDIMTGDEGLMKMVVDNYVSNAVRYANEHSEIQIVMCGNRFTIYNPCEHLSEENLERIWDPLYVCDESRTETDGSAGMGLAICKNILELHGAKYGVENVEGGVRFYFQL